MIADPSSSLESEEGTSSSSYMNVSPHPPNLTDSRNKEAKDYEEGSGPSKKRKSPPPLTPERTHSGSTVGLAGGQANLAGGRAQVETGDSSGTTNARKREQTRIIRKESFCSKIIELLYRKSDLHAGPNPNIWLGYISFGKDQGDPTEGLTFYQIPGIKKFENFFPKTQQDKFRMFGRIVTKGNCSKARVGVDERQESLTQDFYEEYTFVDWSLPHLGPFEFDDYLDNEGELYRGLSDRLCGWATTLMPINKSCAKGLSIVHEGRELVCRTVAFREPRTGTKRTSLVFFCEVCGNICLPEKTVIVACYVYEEEAPENVCSQWRDCMLKVCLLHFLALGQDLGRSKFNINSNKWNSNNYNGGVTLFNS